MTCIIIGGNAAGMSAASRLKRKSPGARVIVFERTGEVSYGACGMPYYIAGFNDSLDKMRIRKPEAFLEQGIDLRLHATVTGIDAVNRRVLWRDAAGDCAAEAYDQLVIASGASPIVPPIKGTDLDGVFTLKTLSDAARIRECIENPGVRSVAIVGGGYIGLELAEACLRQKKTVHVFEGLPRLLNTFDPEFSEAVTDTLVRAGAEVHLAEPATALEGGGCVERLVTERRTYAVDAVVIAVGVRPNTAFVGDAAFDRLKNGALIVDTHMRTSVPNVYAAGDCAAVMHRLTGKPAYLPLGTNANKQGRFAADAILGRDPLGFSALGTAMLRCVDLELARTGLSEQEARDAGFDAGSVTVKAGSHARYYPDPIPITLKLSYEHGTKRLLGAQLMGSRETAWRIDVFACAIDRGMRAEELGRLDLGYAPPFASVWDAIQIAANAIKE